LAKQECYGIEEGNDDPLLNLRLSVPNGGPIRLQVDLAPPHRIPPLESDLQQSMASSIFQPLRPPELPRQGWNDTARQCDGGERSV
jgi:hypothetical protein